MVVFGWSFSVVLFGVAMIVVSVDGNSVCFFGWCCCVGMVPE